MELCSGPAKAKQISNRHPLRHRPAIRRNRDAHLLGYDAYLSTALGIMTPPTEVKRHHDAIIADMDKSYTEYKGEYGA